MPAGRGTLRTWGAAEAEALALVAAALAAEAAGEEAGLPAGVLAVPVVHLPRIVTLASASRLGSLPTGPNPAEDL